MSEKKTTKKTSVKVKATKSVKTTKKEAVIKKEAVVSKAISKDAFGKIISVKGVVVEVAFD